MTRNLNIALSDDDDEINAINLIIVDGYQICLFKRTNLQIVNIFAVDIYGVT